MRNAYPVATLGDLGLQAGYIINCVIILISLTASIAILVLIFQPDYNYVS